MWPPGPLVKMSTLSKLLSPENLFVVFLAAASAAALAGRALDVRWLKLAGFAAWGLAILSLVALGLTVAVCAARERRNSPKS